MSLTADIADLNQRHPDWPAGKIAKFLGASPPTVRSMGRRMRLVFGPKKVISAKRQYRRVAFAGKE